MRSLLLWGLRIVDKCLPADLFRVDPHCYHAVLNDLQLSEFFIYYSKYRDKCDSNVDSDKQEVTVLPAPLSLGKTDNKLTCSCSHCASAINNTCYCWNGFRVPLERLLLPQVSRACSRYHVIQAADEKAKQEHQDKEQPVLLVFIHWIDSVGEGETKSTCKYDSN